MTVEDILEQVPTERQLAFRALHEAIVANLPEGFEPGISYGGLGYVVPHRLYPAGYHCKPAEPLPFAGIASTKSAITFYHMGMYADPDLMAWFVAEFPKHSSRKLDMGKSCVTTAVAIGIVDTLEMIEVQNSEDHLATAIFGFSEQVLRLIHEQAAVDQPSE